MSTETPTHTTTADAPGVIGVSNARLKPSSMPHRWWVSFTATALTPLSVTDGSVDVERIKAEDGEDTRQVNVVIRNHDGEPYIPATGFKGALRTAARLYADTDNRMQRLFGINQGNSRNPGQVDFHDLHGFTAGAITHLPYAQAASGSFVEASTAIDRDRGTAKDRHLYHDERLAPGCSFSGTLFVQAKTKDEGGMIVAELKALFAATVGDGLGLGGDRGRGCGRVALAVNSIRYFGTVELAAWMGEGCPAPWHRNGTDVTNDTTYAPKALGAASDTAPTLRLNIAMHGLFMVKDPSRVTTGKEPTANPALLDATGKPALPARTLHGALRSQSERILRTLGIATGGAGGKPFDATTNVGDALIEALYGSSNRAGGLTQPMPPKCTNNPEKHTQDFIAIDRFTGGGLDGAKFNATPYYKPEFEATLRLRLESTSTFTADHVAAARGLLLLTLRDLAEGDIPVGWGKRKGYGECTATAKDCREGESLAVYAARLFDGSDGQDALNGLRGLPRTRAAIESASASWLSASRAIPDGAQDVHPVNFALPRNNRFHNTYHFIPATLNEMPAWANFPSFQADSKWKDDEGFGIHSHAKLRNGTANDPCFSGTISFSVTNLTPMIIGGKRHPYVDQNGSADGSTAVEAYQIGENYALPATSIKGMLGSLMEVASGSAMRVFDGGERVSYRLVAEDFFDGIGQLARDATGWFIYPLVEGTHFWRVADNAAVMSGRVKLRMRMPSRELVPPNDALPPNSLHVDAGLTHKSFTDQCVRIEDTVVTAFTDLADQIANAQRAQVKLDKGNALKAETAKPYHLIPLASPGEPLSDYFKNLSQRNADAVPGAASEFRLVPKPGDIVRFRTQDAQPPKTFKKGDFAYSAIWRSGARSADANRLDTLGDYLDANLHPLSAHRPNKLLSVAETLLGFVEMVDDSPTKNAQAMAFAGKLRFTDATLSDAANIDEQYTTLRTLAAPKPPSIAFYFRHKSGAASAIEPSSLAVQTHQLQGYKRYLHALRRRNAQATPVANLDVNGSVSAQGAPPWSDVRGPRLNHAGQATQTVRAKLLRRNNVFNASVKFENLTLQEFGLLLYALQPSTEFHHKLGLGKPIGLGTVKIKIVSCNLLNLTDRYELLSLQDDASDAEQQVDATMYEALARQHETNYPALAATFKAIQLLGNPMKVSEPMHYPQRANTDIGSENFRWFAANKAGMRVALRPILADTEETPDLPRH